MRDLSAELKSLNADWLALHEAAESLDIGRPDAVTMLLVELRAARADTRLDDVLAELRAIRELLASVTNNGNAVRLEQALIAATPQRLRRAFHSGAALPGLYSGLFYSARSVRKAMGPLESPKSENPLRKQRAF